MNGKSDDAIKQAFFDALIGLSVTTKGLVADHDESLTHAGVQQIWNALKLADLHVTKSEK